MTDLQVCPICHEKTTKVVVTGYFARIALQCRTCGARTDLFDKLGEAKEAWNEGKVKRR